ncbi:MAG: hypothetical protein K9I97_01440 [Cryomorphaceae bacterium]|jgi:hypothetical protein|nr:hypothetical protein [Cryomorphaceae bacterium]
MKNKLIFLFAGMLLFTVKFIAQTIVSGGIYQNTTWTLANSPYQVNGSIVVFPGNTLTVEPGVTILINNTNAQNIYIETRGTLNMVGTDQLPITVRALVDTTNIGWQGFVCTSSQGGVLNADRFRISNAATPFDYESPVSLYQYTNCRFSHCGEAITVGNEVVLNNCQFRGNEVAVYGWSYFTLNNCYFKDNGTAINAYSTAFTLTNTTFQENTNGIVFSAGVFDSMYIADCVFQNNGSALSAPNNGIVENCTFLDNTIGIQGSYNCQIQNNLFEYNDLGVNISVLTSLTNNQINNNMGGVRISDISSTANAPIVQDNEICNNINFNVDNNTNVNYSLLSNCFCGLDSSSIEQYLLDGYDDITKGLINYQVFDTTCTTILTTVLKFNETSGIESTSTVNMDLSFENPVNQQLHIFSNTPISELTITDMQGKTFHLNAVETNVFDVLNLSTGFYVVTSANEQPVSLKLIKF